MRAYQRFAGLTVDGVVGRTTWNSLYGSASHLRSSGPVVTLKRLPYPGTPLTVGSTAVPCSTTPFFCSALPTTLTAWKTRPSPTSTPTRRRPPPAARRQLLGCRETGVADAETWTAVEALSLQLAADAPNPDRDAGQAGLPGPRHRTRAALGRRWGRWSAGSTAAHAVLRRGLCDRELPLRPGGHRSRAGPHSSGRGCW